MNKSTDHINPPRWSKRLLRSVLRKSYLEEIEGDMEEVFQDNLETTSIRKARRQYNREVLKLVRPALVKKLSGSQKLNYYGMFKQNFIIAFRSYNRYKSAFLINLIGLSTGLACTLLIYLWVNSELQVDQFHAQNDRLYQVLANSSTSSGILTNEATPALLAETMAEEFPEIEMAVTESWTSSYTLAHDETFVKAVGQYASPDYFKVFSYELLQGNKDEVLKGKSSIVISDQLALKLFGTTNDVIGKTLEFQYFRTYQVAGIFKSPPPSSTRQFEFIVNIEEFKELNSWVLNWKNNGPSTFVLLSPNTDIDAFNEKIGDFIKDHNGEQNITAFATPYSDLYLHGKYENGKSVGGRISYVRLFSLVAVLILTIACINFMNLSTARVSRRIKEIGVKKTVGASRRSLVFQFFSESFLMTALAMVTSLFMVSMALPEFNQITDKQLSLIFTWDLALALMAILLATGIISGSYPALFLSAIKPIKILKTQPVGSLRELFMRKVLVVAQFSISIILIVSVLVVQKQIQFTQDKQIGFNKDNILYFEAEGKIELNMETFINELKNVPGVINASSTAHSFVEGGYTGLTQNVNWEGKDPESTIAMEYMRVNYDLLEMMDFEIKAGRSFSRDFKSEYRKVIFNETAIDIMGLEDPIGAIVKDRGRDAQIVGIVKDFHFKTLHEKVGPAYFILQPDATWLIMTKIQQDEERETLVRLEELYETFNPGFNFDYKFLDQDYEAQYKSEQRVATLSSYFSFIAILISCLGLLGLAAFSAERRIKEIGIRKILGSKVADIVILLSKDFTKMVLMAIVIAIPISYYMTAQWLQGFEYRIELTWWLFAGASLSALVIAWLTVGVQTLKAAAVNPAECLRNE